MGGEGDDLAGDAPGRAADDGMLASLENLVRIARTPESRTFMSESLNGAYEDIGRALRESRPDLDTDTAQAIAELYFVLTQGLGILWTITRGDNLPDGARLAKAIAALADES
ncbi:hypothetical protein ACW2Q0_07210 [Nocardia sp. R16R-3T]